MKINYVFSYNFSISIFLENMKRALTRELLIESYFL